MFRCAVCVYVASSIHIQNLIMSVRMQRTVYTQSYWVSFTGRYCCYCHQRILTKFSKIFHVTEFKGEKKKQMTFLLCVCVYLLLINYCYSKMIWMGFLFLFCFIRYYMRHHEKYYTKPSWNINVYRRVIHIPHSRAQIIYIY